jgi:predicted dehydrogenase
VTSVYAEADLPADPADLGVLEERVFVALRHTGGATSHLSADWVQGAPGPRFRVTGTQGAFVLAKTMDRQEPDLIAGRRPGRDEPWGQEDAADFGVLSRGDEQETVPTERGRWDTFYPAFAAAVRGEGPLPVDPWESVAAARVLDAARRSAVSGTVVPL